MPLPTFIILGAGKSGTTSLRSYLKQHPDIFMAPRGEPSFFAHEGQQPAFAGPGDDRWRFVTDIRAYTALFAGAESYRAAGEVSPRYLFYEQACERIKYYVPEARLVAILRHPVDRAYSHFLMNRNRDCEPEPDFRTAIAREDDRMRRGWSWDWSYVGAGRYYEQLLRYYQRFPEEQIKIFLYEDLKYYPEDFFRELFAFLGVDPSFRPETARKHRSSASPRIDSVHALLHEPSLLKAITKRLLPPAIRQKIKWTVSSWNAVRPDPVSPSLKQELFMQYFADDCLRLERLIDKDLSHWTGAVRHASSIS